MVKCTRFVEPKNLPLGQAYVAEPCPNEADPGHDECHAHRTEPRTGIDRRRAKHAQTWASYSQPGRR